MKKNWFWFILAVLVLLNCGGYEKLLKSSDFNLKYEKAFYYYNKGDYTKALALFDQIAPSFRGTTRADSVYFYQAMVNFKLSDYILAGHYFKTFASTYGNSEFAEEATFYVAYCYYLSSPRPELDQTDTYNAIQALRLFLIKYPDSKRRDECAKMINEMRDKLVEKSYISAKLYFDLQDYKASIVALNNSLNDYPESKYREDILYLILRSNYMLASNSIAVKQKERYQATLDEYYSFISEFPDSKFRKDADKMYSDAAKALNIDTSNTTNNDSNLN